MRKACFFAAFLLGVAPAMAQPALPPGVNATPPKSIWAIDLDGTATNPQSQLQCPATLAGFRRVNLLTYNPLGTDVSCGYNGRGVITVYLARYSPQPTPQQYFDSAKQAIVQTAPDAAARGDVPAGPAGLTWIAGGFTIEGGKTNSDLWVASLADWTAQIRATYPADATPAIKDFMTAYSAVLAKTAAPHLAACQASPPPARPGVKLDTDTSTLLALVLEGAATTITPIPASAANENWCMERSLSLGAKPYLYWRNIADAPDRNMDRIAPLGEGITLTIVRDDGGKPLVGKIAASPAKDDVYDLIEESGDIFSVHGVFDGRPSFETVADLMSKPHDIYASMDAATKKLSLSGKVFQAPQGATQPK